MASVHAYPPLSDHLWLCASINQKSMKPEIIEFKPLGDSRGHLVAVESNVSIPFDVKRVYYIYGTVEDIERGFHAHKALNQVAVAIAGSCDMVLDDGEDTATVRLDSAAQGVCIKPAVWHYMKNFSKDCVLLVFADQHYDESDYLRDYDAFKLWLTSN